MASELIFQRLVPHYRIAIFKRLCERRDLLVCHSVPQAHSSLLGGENLNFPNMLLRRIYYGKKSTAVIQNPLPLLLKTRPKLIVSEYGLLYLTMWLLLMLRPFFGYRLGLYTHGVGNRDVLAPFKSRVGRLSLFLLNQMDFLIFYSERRENLAKPFLKKTISTYHVSNTRDSDEFESIYQKIKSDPKVEDGILKLIFVGRLIESKKIDLLIDVLKKLNQKMKCELTVIGDGPEKNLVDQAIADGLPIQALGAITDTEIIAKTLFHSHLQIVTGEVGLAIVDSFLMGVPLVTFERTALGPFHGPEFDYLENDKNGVVVKGGVNEMAGAIEALSKDSEKMKKLSIEARTTAVIQFGIDKFVREFSHALDEEKKAK